LPRFEERFDCAKKLPLARQLIIAESLTFPTVFESDSGRRGGGVESRELRIRFAWRGLVASRLEHDLGQADHMSELDPLEEPGSPDDSLHQFSLECIPRLEIGQERVEPLCVCFRVLAWHDIECGGHAVRDAIEP
jgi:hypothetical protein